MRCNVLTSTFLGKPLEEKQEQLRFRRCAELEELHLE